MAAPAMIALLRPWQWYKNLVVFVPLLFAKAFFDPRLWGLSFLAFGSFCLLSGATYCWNDVIDAQRDRAHPTKRNRPIASGKIRPGVALVYGGVLAAIGLAALATTNGPTLLLATTFLLIQVLYNAVLKNTVIWDVLLIGVGFVLRALAGTTILEVGNPTVWLILCTFLFALFLAFGKRRHELLLLGSASNDRKQHRSVLGEYTVELVEQMTVIVAGLLLASYVLYTALGTADPWMMFTIPFAMYGVFRYLYLVKRRGQGDEPELLFLDRATIVNAVAWTVAVALVLVGAPQRLFEWLQGL